MKLPVFAILFLSLACANPLRSQPKVCPSMPVWPHALIEFTKPLAATTYNIELDLDGNKESCTLEIGASVPAKDLGGVVQSPMTKTDTSCKLISISGISSDGTVNTLRLAKPNEKMTVPFSFKMSAGGTLVAESNAPLTFTPTDTLGEGCGRTDVAKLSLTQK